MKAFELKYGCNPNQKPARIYMEGGAELPLARGKYDEIHRAFIERN